MKKELMQDFLSKLPEDTPIIINFPHEKKAAYLSRTPYYKSTLFIVGESREFPINPDNVLTAGDISKCLSKNPEIKEILFADPENQWKQTYDLKANGPGIIQKKDCDKIIFFDVAFEYHARIFVNDELLATLGGFSTRERAENAAIEFIRDVNCDENDYYAQIIVM